MDLVHVKSGGVVILCCLLDNGAVPGSVDSASIPLSLGRGIYLLTQSQASYHSASWSPLARCPCPCFDVDNKEANVRKNVVVADGHANVCCDDRQ